MTDLWPWLVMAGLGAYHGLNPAMGWLFAVSLGMQDRDRRSVKRALIPIAVGHELSIALVAGLVVVLGVLTDSTVLHIGAAVLLIALGSSASPSRGPTSGGSRGASTAGS